MAAIEGAGGPAAAETRDGGPLDLAHLRRCVGDDARLEREVLALFDRHAGETLSLILAAGDAVSRQQAAHALRGSAMAVGAWRVAELALAVEAGPGEGAAIRPVLVALEGATAAARTCAWQRIAATPPGEAP